MISLALATALHLAAQDAATQQLRRDFGGCLDKAVSPSIAKRLEPEAFETEVRAACAAEEGKLKSALIAFDVKMGSKRADAEEGAALQIDDYLANINDAYQESYRSAAERSKKAEEAAAAPVTPEPTSAAEPDIP